LQLIPYASRTSLGWSGLSENIGQPVLQRREDVRFPHDEDGEDVLLVECRNPASSGVRRAFFADQTAVCVDRDVDRLRGLQFPPLDGDIEMNFSERGQVGRLGSEQSARTEVAVVLQVDDERGQLAIAKDHIGGEGDFAVARSQ
jgi:hypothetical protein